MIVEDGLTLSNCLAYIDLNPVRAGLVEHPENYRWNILGHLAQMGIADGWLTLKFDLHHEALRSLEERIAGYQQFVHEIGGLHPRASMEEPSTLPSRVDRFFRRTRYLTDSEIIGSPGFVKTLAGKNQSHFNSKREKIPN